MTRRILILGGTGEARRLAAQLVGVGHDVTTSLAGVTTDPLIPEGRVRKGGFGGADGLADYIKSEHFDVVVDATHAYAAQISANAAQAGAHCGVPVLRLERPEWQAGKGDRWLHAADAAEAMARLDEGARVLLTIGRKEVGLFSARTDIGIVARMIEAPQIEVPESWRIILARPPFSLNDEITLMRKEKISVVVSKNAGGAWPAKLEAARQLGLPVIMIARPVKPDVPVYATVEDMAAAVAGE